MNNYTASILYLTGELATIKIKQYKIGDGVFYFAGVDFDMWVPMTSVRSVTVTEETL